MEAVTLSSVRRAIRSGGSPARAAGCLRFFKTGKGEYGEGDKFIGLNSAQIGALAQRFVAAPDSLLAVLMRSVFHEERAIALDILTLQIPKATPQRRRQIARLYWKHRAGVNNWDLVDMSAYKILGPAHGAALVPLIKKWARTGTFWEKRIAMVATFHFIRLGNSAPTLAVARILLKEKQDLLQKATGWMLREVGKRCGQNVLEAFLKKHHAIMGRTALRYAIERFPEALRLKYLRL